MSTKTIRFGAYVLCALVGAILVNMGISLPVDAWVSVVLLALGFVMFTVAEPISRKISTQVEASNSSTNT